jgi:hypothetical protein
MESVYHIVTICVNETSWAHVWRLHSPFLETGYDIGGEAFRRGRGEERSSVRGGMLQGSSGAFIGAGGHRRGMAGVTAALMALMPLKTGARLRGGLRGGVMVGR